MSVEAMRMLIPLIAAAVLSTPGATRPNVVLILADDLGVEALSCYGGQSYETPNIDALAERSVRFEYCFSNPLCSPSRGELLTGREPLHTGIPRVIFDPEKHREFMDPGKQQSIANLFQNVGYKTVMAGKWQLSFLHERDTIAAFGFDDYQAWQIFRDGVKTSRFANPSLRRNGVLRDEVTGGYGPDENCAFVMDFIRRHREAPFFAYYACLLPHWPWEPTPASDDRLKKAEGIGDPKYFPDMVAYLDEIVGRILRHLEALGLRDDTLVLFVADNGTDRRLTSTWSNGERIAEVEGGKGTMTDAGTHVPLLVHWPGHVDAGVCSDLVELCDVFPTLAEICELPEPRNRLNGISFASQLGVVDREPTVRDWVHCQNVGSRHVRSKRYILTNRGALRRVVGIGEIEPKPISGELTAAEKAVKVDLEAGLKAVAELEMGNGD